MQSRVNWLYYTLWMWSCSTIAICYRMKLNAKLGVESLAAIWLIAFKLYKVSTE